jgi:hypothetical protein
VEERDPREDITAIWLESKLREVRLIFVPVRDSQGIVIPRSEATRDLLFHLS